MSPHLSRSGHFRSLSTQSFRNLISSATILKSRPTAKIFLTLGKYKNVLALLTVLVSDDLGVFVSLSWGEGDREIDLSNLTCQLGADLDAQTVGWKITRV